MRVTIDNTDLATLGIFILKDWDFDLLSFPERKSPPQNDWFERDGLDCDLSEVLFKPKKVKIKYFVNGEDATTFQSRYNAFETLHQQSGYRQLFIEAFNRTYELRTLEFSGYEHQGGLDKSGRKWGFIEVTYSMDNPLQYFTSLGDTPTLSRHSLAHVQLNGIDFSKFGIVIEKAYHTILQKSSPKLGIEYESKYGSGIIADVGFKPKKKSRKLELVCTMLTNTYGEFETNYTALFHQLTKPEAISIGIKTGEIPCYYSAMKDFKKIKPLSAGALVKFKIELITI